MIRFTLKAGIAAGAVYILNKEGVWKDSQEALKVYDKLNTTFKPYVKEISNQIPIELPMIPNTQSPTDTIGTLWNKGVTFTFQFLSELPDDVNKWTNEGVSALLTNPEVQNLLQSNKNDAESVKK